MIENCSILLDGHSTTLYLIFVLFAGVFVVYRFLARLAHIKFFEVFEKGTVQIGTRAVFLLILFFVVLSESLGVESILGAFLAGVIVSLLSPRKDFVHQLDSFGYGFLIPIFFVMVGVRMEIWDLMKDPKALLLIPMLLIAMYVAKIIPALILNKWFSFKEVISSGILLSSKLSLVIAASAVALDLGVITERVNGAIILVSILTCLISPVLFAKLMPKKEEHSKWIAVIGTNEVTVPVTIDLLKDGYDVKIFRKEREGDEEKNLQSLIKNCCLVDLPAISIHELDKAGAFQAEVVVCGSKDDDYNQELAKFAKLKGVERVVIRLEKEQKHQLLQEEGFEVFSSLYATRTLLKGMIEHPLLYSYLTHPEDDFEEITILNFEYDNVPVREFPFLGDTLILKIVRQDESIIPHGKTKLRVGDQLLVSGSPEYIQVLKQRLGSL